MATLTFTGSRPTPRQKSVLVVGQVNAEPITVVVDESWSGLQLELQFFNSTTHPEVPVVVILDRTMTCKVPPEVTKEVGIVHVALAGRDSGTIIKLSEKLYYADAKIGADPQGGLTPEQQTPDYIAQMIAIQEETKAVAQSVRNDADNRLFDGEPGKSPIIQGGNWWIWDVEAQEYRDTGIAASGGGGGTTDYTELTNKPKINGIDLLGNKTAQELNLQPKGDYAQKTDIPAKLPAPYTLTFAGAVEAAYDGSQAVTVTIPTIAGPPGVSPTVSTEEIDGGARVTITDKAGPKSFDVMDGKTPVKGTDYFTESEIQDVAKQAAALVPGGGGGSSGGEVMLAEYIHRGNQEIYFSSFDWASGIGECTEPHGLTEAKKVLLVPNEWWTGSDFVGKGITSIPIEWIIYTGANIYAVPTDETHVKITGSDKETIIQVDIGDVSNTLIDATKFHVELPIGFSIKELPVDCTSIRVFAFGITGTLGYRYISLYTNRRYRDRVWPEGFLSPPATGLSKAKYALVFWYDICAEAVPAGAVFVMNNLYKAQRKGYSYWVGDRTAEYLVTNYGSGSDNRAEIFTGLLIENGNACYANHTVFRIYAKAVKQE